MGKYKTIRIQGKNLPKHRLIASRALGRPLPTGVEVHHIDENTRNNRGTNLVICEDRQYHRLLHSRKRVLDAGGNPNTEKICFKCQKLKLKTDFVIATAKFDGLRADCRDCMKVRKQQYRTRSLNVTAWGIGGEE